MIVVYRRSVPLTICKKQKGADCHCADEKACHSASSMEGTEMVGKFWSWEDYLKGIAAIRERFPGQNFVHCMEHRIKEKAPDKEPEKEKPIRLRLEAVAWHTGKDLSLIPEIAGRLFPGAAELDMHQCGKIVDALK